MNYSIIGGAGFIGSHVTHFLLKNSVTKKITVYDNFSSGKIEYLTDIKNDQRLEIIKGDVKDLDKLCDSIKGSDIIYHFASNPDISKAVTQPDIDFWEGTYLTQNILEAMRKTFVKQLIYASGSGVYGDYKDKPVFEDIGPMLPISTYGASKLAGEALISAYSHMFDIKALAFRFANVVGPKQTHGVGYDFLRSLISDPSKLRILGDGTQSKSYIHVSDIIRGIEFALNNSTKKFDVFNLSTDDYISVNEIAQLVIEILSLKEVKFEYTGGDRGWRGDIPVVRFNTNKIKALGWTSEFSTKDAIRDSILHMKQEIGV